MIKSHVSWNVSRWSEFCGSNKTVGAYYKASEATFLIHGVGTKTPIQVDCDDCLRSHGFLICRDTLLSNLNPSTSPCQDVKNFHDSKIRVCYCLLHFIALLLRISPPRK